MVRANDKYDKILEDLYDQNAATITDTSTSASFEELQQQQQQQQDSV